ncbi:PLP-dependent aminotransferase family protein [Amycolatopsis nigrescens]|uniref:MocR-like pyridoxine biosynthesis transcription factor PdxR n=1 Tax=Amycolatopsis nigrescens TaxID=381445 RepID=UPI000378B22D|nr:PLP-dependent aminotransferase family protein [Amycolatopsis nigrescens]
MTVDIHVDLAGGRGRKEQIYRQIRAAILDGRLRPGETLTPTRELAERLAVSRNTVSAAYDQLTAEGFLTATVGAGTFVRSGIHREKPAPRPVPEGTGVSATELWAGVPKPPRSFAPAPEYDFRAGVPDVTLFPFDTWRRLVAQQLRGSGADVLTYGDPAGLPALRAAIVRQVGVSRDVVADPDDVLVTSGAQQAVDLLARVLLRPGDKVAVEDPGYPPPRHLFESLGAQVIGVPVDDEGIVVSRIPPGVRLVHVTPSHQYPLGLAMSLARRMELISWARRNDAVLVEDDYDTDFRYGGRPLEPLYSLDTTGRVLYVGSFSKVLYPSMRLGFLVAPPALREPLRKAKYLSDWQSGGPAQAALAQFMEEGGFARHVRRMRRVYQSRHQVLAAALKSDFADLLTPVPCAAGLHLSATGECGTRRLVRAARRHGVSLYALGDFTMRRTEVRGLVFGFGAIATERIVPGLRRLREIAEELRD